MKRFALAAVLAVAGALGLSGTADAQFVTGYNTYNPYSGVIVSRGMGYYPGATASSTAFYNPFWGYGGQQAAYADIFGNRTVRGFGYNPYTGLNYTYGVYNPGLGVSPLAGYRYGFVWR
jgi:hypothetical protein